MPPKAQDDIKALVISLKESLEEKLDGLVERFDSLTKSLNDVKMENTKMEKTVRNLSSLVNDREQHSRNSSIRVSGIPISEETARDAIATSKLIYDSLLHPILSLAVNEEIIPSVPSLFQLVEHCHIIPSRKQDSSKPAEPASTVIVRFQSRLIRQLVFKFKKTYLDVPDRRHIFIAEDLTKVNYIKLMEIKKNPNTSAAWSRAGKIFYTSKNEPNTRLSL